MQIIENIIVSYFLREIGTLTVYSLSDVHIYKQLKKNKALLQHILIRVIHFFGKII